MANNLVSLYAIGSVPTFTLVNKVTGTTVEFNHINSAEADIKNDVFMAKKQGSSSIVFAKPTSGTLKVGAEETSDFIKSQVLSMDLVKPAVGNGVTVFKTKELKAGASGAITALAITDVPLTGTMMLYNSTRDVEYKLVTGVPAVGEYKFDTTTRVLTINGAVEGDIFYLDGRVLDETKQKMTYLGNPKIATFEGYLNIFRTYEDGEVKMETIHFPRLSPKPNLKISAEAEKVSDLSLEFEVLQSNVNGKSVMAEFIV